MDRLGGSPVIRVGAWAILALLGLAGCAQKPPPASAETVAAHVAEARRLAGEDLKPLLGLCNPAPSIRPDQASIDKLLAAVTSTLVTGSAPTTSQRAQVGESATASRARSRKNSALAKNSGASQRNSTSPGTTRAAG